MHQVLYKRSSGSCRTGPMASSVAAEVLRAVLLLLLWGTAQTTVAAEVAAIKVTRNGDRFDTHALIVLDASPRAVFEALQDYAQLPSFNPDIRTARVLGKQANGDVQVDTEIHACVAFFCKTVHQEQIMHATPRADGGVVTSRILPRKGDFNRYSGRWNVTACGNGRASACMHLDLSFTPDFWVPPVIGPWLIRARMQHDAAASSVGLEKLARKLDQE